MDEDLLGRRIHRLIEAEALPLELSEVVSHHSGPTWTKRVLVAAAVLVVVIAGFTIGVVRRSGSSSDLAVQTHGPADTSLSTSTSMTQLVPVGEWVSVPPAPLVPRGGASVASSPTSVFVWGGRDVESGEAFTDGAIFDTSSQKWTIIPAPPDEPGRSDASAVWTGSRFVVLGGRPSLDSSRSVDTVLAFDPATTSWERWGSDPRAAITGAAAFSMDDEIVVVGGARTPEGGATNAVSGLNVIDRSWHDLPSAPWPVSKSTTPGLLEDAAPAVMTAGGVVTVATRPGIDGYKLASARFVDGQWSMGPVAALGKPEYADPSATLLAPLGPSSVIVLGKFEETWTATLNTTSWTWSNRTSVGPCDKGSANGASGGGAGAVAIMCGEWRTFDLQGTPVPTAPPDLAIPTAIEFTGDVAVAIDLGVPEGWSNGPPRAGSAAMLRL